MEIIELDSKEEAAAAAGEALNSTILAHKKTPVLLMLSAGSAFEVLDYVGEMALGENLTVCMLDDRFSESAEINNFLQMQKLDFYALALSKDVNFFGTLPRPNENISELAERFENNLKNWRKEYPGGVIIATFGMGADGHTAGIFPENNEQMFEDLMQSEPWVVGYNVGNKHKYSERVTTTLTFFKEINFGIGFICGKDKKTAFNALNTNALPINLLPAVALKEIKNLEIFTDIK